MKRVHMALCFLDDYDKVVTKEDLNIHWNLPEEQEKNRLENVLVMDEVAAMLNKTLQDDLYTRIRELLEKSTDDKPL